MLGINISHISSLSKPTLCYKRYSESRSSLESVPVDLLLDHPSPFLFSFVLCCNITLIISTVKR